MHAVRGRELGQGHYVRVGAGLLLGIALSAGRASASDSPQTNSEAAWIVRAALTPYVNARAYKGTLSTTTVAGRRESERNTTTSIFARCDKDGNIIRLRAQTITWGHDKDLDISGNDDATLIYDGTTLWLYRPGDQRYCRCTHKLPTLASLLGLPPAEAAWSVVPPKRDDPSDERSFRAQTDGSTWTVVIDTASGRLRRVERVTKQGSRSTLTTLTLRDMAFDEAASLPDGRFMFQPPREAREDVRAMPPRLSLMP